MKLTKEKMQERMHELEKQIFELGAEKELLLKEDKHKRVEFSKALKSYKPSRFGSLVEELEILTWEQIFVELGRLLANKQSSKIEERFNQIYTNIAHIEGKINQLNTEK